MNVSRDVVRDLLTVYLASEASPDTKAFVEDYLRTDAELAREVDAARAGLLAMPKTGPPAPSAGKEALDATRKLLSERTWTFAVGLLFTLLPLSVAGEGSRVTFLLIRDAPTLGFGLWATAAVVWVWHARIRRRLRVPGL
jgi:anti-sigma factor RsiW